MAISKIDQTFQSFQNKELIHADHKKMDSYSQDIYDLDIEVKVEPSTGENQMTETVGCDISQYCNYTKKCK